MAKIQLDVDDFTDDDRLADAKEHLAEARREHEPPDPADDVLCHACGRTIGDDEPAVKCACTRSRWCHGCEELVAPGTQTSDRCIPTLVICRTRCQAEMFAEDAVISLNGRFFCTELCHEHAHLEENEESHVDLG